MTSGYWPNKPKTWHVVYLSRVRLNPYVGMLAHAVESLAGGFACHEQTRLGVFDLWIGRPDILHIHWPEHQYEHRCRWLAGARYVVFKLLMALAILRGTKLVFTVHNMSPHDTPHPEIAKRLNAWLLKTADAIHAHDGMTAQLLAKAEARRHIHIIPHPDYRSAYPNRVSCEEARSHFGFSPVDFVVLLLGFIRPYKGIENLITSFTSSRLPAGRLILAGRVLSTEFGKKLDALIRPHSGIVWNNQYVADDALQIYFNSADFCVLPYTRATTSGAAMLALSFSRPIIAPHSAAFHECLDAGCGVSFGDTVPLEQALRQAYERRFERWSLAIDRFLEGRDRTTVAAKHMAVYDRILASDH